MMNIILKPIVWNSLNYEGPCGPAATFGFPAQRGYGGEEWNNSPDNQFKKDDITYCVFHAEGDIRKIGTLDDTPTIVLMIASHGVQHLVGIAIDPEMLLPTERQALVATPALKERWRKIWDVSLVQDKHHYDKSEFLRFWRKTSKYSLRWKCPQERYFWFQEPVPLDASKVTGKKKFSTHYGGFQMINLIQLDRVLAQVPIQALKVSDRERFKRFVADIQSPDSFVKQLVRMEDELSSYEGPTEALGQAVRRIGHDRWRESVRADWNYQCAVTGCDVMATLRAGHIVKWSASEKTRLDPHNGLLLVGTLDLLFEKCLITFDDNGSILISNTLSENQKKLLGLKASMTLRRTPHPQQLKYLRKHREDFLG